MQKIIKYQLVRDACAITVKSEGYWDRLNSEQTDLECVRNFLDYFSCDTKANGVGKLEFTPIHLYNVFVNKQTKGIACYHEHNLYYLSFAVLHCDEVEL